MAEHDPLEKIHGLWRDLAEPPAQLSERDLEQGEGEAVAWIRAAWRRLETPAWESAHPWKPRASARTTVGAAACGRALDGYSPASRLLALALAASALVVLMLSPRGFTPPERAPTTGARCPPCS